MIIDVVVASTSRFHKFGPVSSPEEAEDLSGKVILETIKANGHTAHYRLLPDGIEPIREAVEKSDCRCRSYLRRHRTYSSGLNSGSCGAAL